MLRRETEEFETVEAVEGEIRDLVDRELVKPRAQAVSDSELATSNVSLLLQRVSATSVQEIDRLISELETMRDHLRHEGDRVQRDLVNYASTSQTAMQSIKGMSESLTPWKNAVDAGASRLRNRVGG
jgi:hypothetical protein